MRNLSFYIGEDVPERDPLGRTEAKLNLEIPREYFELLSKALDEGLRARKNFVSVALPGAVREVKRG